MKQCTRCGLPLNDIEQYCSRCGGTSFRQVQPQGQQQSQLNNHMQGQQRPVMNQGQIQGQFNRQQRPMQGQPIQQNRTQSNRPAQPNRPIQGQVPVQNQQQYNNQNAEGMSNQHVNQFTDATVMKLKKMSKKEKQSKELELMYAMKAATERGEYFDEEQFKQQHGWYVTDKVDKQNSGDMTVIDWIKTLLIMLIPVVNIIVAILGIKNTSNPDYKKNYFKAFLIYYVVSITISILITLLL